MHEETFKWVWGIAALQTAARSRKRQLKSAFGEYMVTMCCRSESGRLVEAEVMESHIKGRFGEAAASNWIWRKKELPRE